MIYLASPYSHSDPIVREQRFDAACHAAAELMRAGHVVFSPVAHSHPVAQHGLPTDWSYWERVDRRFLDVCDEVVVLMLDGWRESVGVRAEIRMAGELGKPVTYRAPIIPGARAGGGRLAAREGTEGFRPRDRNPVHAFGPPKP